MSNLYTNIDKLVKHNKSGVYMFFNYSEVNYCCKVILTNNAFYAVRNDGKLSIIKNFMMIQSLFFDCVSKIADKKIATNLKNRYLFLNKPNNWRSVT